MWVFTYAGLLVVIFHRPLRHSLGTPGGVKTTGGESSSGLQCDWNSLQRGRLAPHTHPAEYRQCKGAVPASYAFREYTKFPYAQDSARCTVNRCQ